VLRICRALYEGGETQAAGAELLGLSASALSERLKRWGMTWPPPEGLDRGDARRW
jgi:predicted transcriptional regulator